MDLKALLVLITLCLNGLLSAQPYSISSNGTGGGAWSTASSWAENRIPICGDTIIIQSGDLIDISGQIDFGDAHCNLYMFLMIEGTLDFASNGPKLRFPCNGSSIEVGATGSVIRTGGGGGQSNYISICEDVVWTGTDPDITDPIILTGPLPIELLSFDIKALNQSCLINWVTGSEVNNDYFTIERSRDANFWEVLAIVNGSGNSSASIAYVYRDFSPWTGLSYYRLRQTDFDGSYVTFDAKSFYSGTQLEVSLYPNPADDRVHISGPEMVEVEFQDALGKVHIVATVESDSEQFGIDVSTLPDGVYQLKFTAKDGTQVGEVLYILH
jgi:hypothetical protein